MGTYTYQNCRDQLALVSTAKTNIKNVIITRGVEVPDDTPLSDYPNKIALIAGDKPEETCTQTITSNGTQTFTPTLGYVFDSAVITTDVHPSSSLSTTYTTNGTHTETGEWTNATITVNVPGLADMFNSTGSTSKIFFYDPNDGGDYSAIIADLQTIGWTAQPIGSRIFSLNYTPNDAIPTVNF